ncbi:MAG: lactate racemase domain-containing protein [Phycisphaerae bacterium]|nr:lactate racemase domain-containing protein [Phycisphaerae bacterium]
MTLSAAELNWRTGQPIRVPWGDAELDLGLPADWAAFDARPAPMDGLAQPLGELLDAQLANPLGLPPLRQIARSLSRADGQPARVAIVVDDNTRHTPAADVLPVVLDHLGAGRQIADSQIELHFAGGTHQPMSREQMAEKVGPALAARFACFNNPYRDPSQYRYLGVTRNHTSIHLSARVADADLRILIGSVSAHLQAGFAGGLKMLFPGLSSLATIKKLHLAGTSRFRQLVGLPAGSNPMRQEIDRLGEFLDGVTFAVQLMLDERHQPIAVSAGEPIAAQRALAAQGSRRFGVALPGLADLLVANSFPLEYDLWQGFKCIANTLFAARDGGVIVAMLKADHGSNGMKIPKWTVSRKLLRTVLRFTGREGLLSLLGRLLPQVNDEAKFFARFCLGTISRNDVLLYAPTLVAEGVRFPGLELYDNLPAVWARARELLGGAPNVTVFGRGGVCYPLQGGEMQNAKCKMQNGK